MIARRPALVVGLAAGILLLLITIPYREHITYISSQASEKLANYRWHVDETDELGKTPPASSPYNSNAPSSSSSSSWNFWKSSSSAASSEPDDPSLAYRKHLEATTSPATFKHSKTLTFSHIYVLNLPARTDRKERMQKIADALGLEFTFVDATHSSLPVIQWIGERVKEVRAWKRPVLDEILQPFGVRTGGMAIGSVWLWNNEAGKGVTLPKITELDDRWGGKDWVTHLETTDPSTLLPKDPKFNVTKQLWDHTEGNDFRQIREAVIATWYSQSRVWKLMQENNDESALVLEDDVDMEWDIERMWANTHRRLPEDWEAAFLGHCWGRELGKPAYLHPLLHQSSEPRCLHGYAFSRAGYTKLIKMMQDPWVAYQTAVDTAIPTFIRDDVLNAYSIEPCFIIQSKDLRSDIQSGIGSPWRGVLTDSTLERVWRDEGHDIPEVTWAQAMRNPHPDPATVWRVNPSPKERDRAEKQQKAAAEAEAIKQAKLAGKPLPVKTGAVPEAVGLDAALARGGEHPSRYPADVIGQQRQERSL